MTLTTVNPLPAYLYQEYADDPDVQAFVDAQKDAVQTYVDWFSSTNLADYTSLAAPLLQWVARGLYGMQETSLPSPITPALGMLNTWRLNTLALNTGTEPSQTSYQITDDVFQRILTWNLYKGDGKWFSMRWLKRRIARFIFGVNGKDPTPFNNPGFQIGCENTQGISVVVSGHVLTVTINQALMSNQVQLTPWILQYFSLAFLSGVLELPLQYTYAVTIGNVFNAFATPSTINITTTSSTHTTPETILTIGGGSGVYTFAWTWLTGGASISIDDPSSIFTTFTGSGMVPGNVYDGVAQCVITDTVTSDILEVNVNVVINCIAGPMLLADPGGDPILVDTSGDNLLVDM